jgi:hypothetical protein
MSDTTNTVNTGEAEAELRKLMDQQTELSAKIDAQKKATREAALANVKKLCETYEFTATDLRGSLKVKRTATPRKSTPRKSKRS